VREKKLRSRRGRHVLHRDHTRGSRKDKMYVSLAALRFGLRVWYARVPFSLRY